MSLQHGTKNGDIKLTILSPNQITRWNSGHQQLRNDIRDWSLLDVEQLGVGFRGIKEQKKYSVHMLFGEYGWPDVVMTYGLRYTAPFEGIGDLTIPKIHFACDLTEPRPGFTGTTDWYKRILDRDKYDFFFVHTMRVYHWLIKHGYATQKTVYWIPFGADMGRFLPWAENKDIDVSTMWSIHDGVYPGRRQIDEALNQMATHDKFIKVQTGKLFHARYAGALSRSKIAVNTTSIYKAFNMKILEAMASRCVLFTTDWDDRPLMKDFVDNDSIVIFDGTVDDLINKIIWLLYDEGTVDRIGQRAFEVAKKHSNYKRAEDVGKVIRVWMSQ